jgi:hypothetical protein
MDPTTSATIEKINAQIANLEEQIASAKKTINGLCVMEGEAPLYPDVDARRNTGAAFRGDQFFGKPMATAAKMILEHRASRNLGAISLAELYDVMKAGGFSFGNSDPKIARRNLSITLSKNPAFMRVPANNHIGLAEWYPNVKKKKDGNGTEDDGEPSAKSKKRKEA